LVKNKANDEYYNEAVLRFLIILQMRTGHAVVQLILSKSDAFRKDKVEEKKKEMAEGESFAKP